MISVLTGDIVGSQGLSQVKRSNLQASLEEAAASTDQAVCIEVFAGDSWQCTCHPPHSAIRLAVAMQAHLLGLFGLETRISIGIGDYETLRPEKISLSQGEAFVLSGRGLKEMEEDEQRLSIQTSEKLPRESRELIHAAVLLLDGITCSWTAKQAQAVALANTLAPQNELAQRFNPPISAQAFGKHLASAQWKRVKNALASIELGLNATLEKNKA